MKKEIIVCDKCGREIHKGEKYTQRPKDLHSNRVSDIEDICRDCDYTRTDNYFIGDQVLTEFIAVVNKKFWNIL